MFIVQPSMYPDPLLETHHLEEALNRAIKFILDLPRHARSKTVLIYQHRGEDGRGGWYFERSRIICTVSYDFEMDFTNRVWHTDRKSAERYEARYCLDD